MELAASLAHDLSWHGLLVFAGLFTAVWFSWVGFTLYANRFNTDDVVLRIGKLAATLAIGGCAAAASGATDDYSGPSAVCYLLGRVMLLLMCVRRGGTSLTPGLRSPCIWRRLVSASRYGRCP